MTLEKDVAAHYTTDDLLDRIRTGLSQAGVDPDTPTPADLKGVDEFHTGGVRATDELLDQLPIGPRTRVLDIGCGLGGTARHIASRFGASVTGVDLTPHFVEVGQRLNALVGLGDKVTLMRGSALDLPVVENSCDLVTMFHVGMNIPDKDRLMAEANRVLAPGGIFAVFDVMRLGEARELTFPLPWSEGAATSFVDPATTYLDAAENVGLICKSIRNRGDFALEFFREAFDRIEAAGGPPPVGIHLLMHDTGAEKLRNYVADVKAERIAPFELIFRKPV